MRQQLIEEAVNAWHHGTWFKLSDLTKQEHSYAMGVIEDGEEPSLTPIETHVERSHMRSHTEDTKETSEMRQDLIEESLEALRDRCWHLVPWDKLTPKEIEYVHSSMEDE